MTEEADSYLTPEARARIAVEVTDYSHLFTVRAGAALPQPTTE